MKKTSKWEIKYPKFKNFPKIHIIKPPIIIGAIRKLINIFEIKKLKDIVLKLYKIIGNMHICTHILKIKF